MLTLKQQKRTHTHKKNKKTTKSGHICPRLSSDSLQINKSIITFSWPFETLILIDFVVVVYTRYFKSCWLVNMLKQQLWHFRDPELHGHFRWCGTGTRVWKPQTASQPVWVGRDSIAGIAVYFALNFWKHILHHIFPYHKASLGNKKKPQTTCYAIVQNCSKTYFLWWKLALALRTTPLTSVSSLSGWCRINLPGPDVTTSLSNRHQVQARKTFCDNHPLSYNPFWMSLCRISRLYWTDAPGNLCRLCVPSLKFTIDFVLCINCHHGDHRLWLLPRSHFFQHVHRLLALLLQQEDVFFCHALCDGRDCSRQRWSR